MLDGQYLCLRQPTVRAALGVADSARGYPRLERPLQVLLIGDTCENLPGAAAEVREIQALYQARRGLAEVRVLLGADASFSAVSSALQAGKFDIIHFAGHAWFDAQESYLVVHDEEILRAREFGTMLSARPPAVLYLNSHYTAFVPSGTDRKLLAQSTSSLPTFSSTGTGRAGFTDTATTVGVGAFLGCFGWASDEGAKAVAVDVHRKLLDGLPIARALYEVRHSHRQSGVSAFDALSCALSGHASMALPVH